jgi:hypothetical protein
MPNNDVIKFECPYCAQHIEASAKMIGTITMCPSCGKDLTVLDKALGKLLQKGQMSDMKLPAPLAGELKGRSERTRDIAAGFAAVAKWVLILYCITVGVAAVFAWVAAVGGDKSDCYWMIYVGGAAVGVAAWCFLLAQIIYIRAALEK